MGFVDKLTKSLHEDCIMEADSVCKDCPLDAMIHIFDKSEYGNHK